MCWFQSGISLCLTFHNGNGKIPARSTFQSGISLCLTFHYGTPDLATKIRARRFQSGISLCLTFHMHVEGRCPIRAT